MAGIVSDPGANPPAVQGDGKGAAASAPSVDIDAIVAKVVEGVMPRISAEITGATKRHSASLRDEVKDMLKGLTPAAPKVEEPAADPASLPLKEQISRLTAQLQERDKQTEREANLRKSAEVRATLEPLVVPGAAKYVVADFIARAQRGEDGNYYLKDGEATLSLLDGFKAEMAKLPDKGASILRASGVATGSGAGDASGRPAPAAVAGSYKSKREITQDKRTNAKGEVVWETTPESTARAMAFLRQPDGRALMDALPDR
jgi:hypothetical protein